MRERRDEGGAWNGSRDRRAEATRRDRGRRKKTPACFYARQFPVGQGHLSSFRP
ncbi:hypothetical protein STXM2123_1244 [Streptomyces sp. F-3]|nr:hypothetical protein STXM2123_1244 [Streptomyces sp. F-3]